MIGCQFSRHSGNLLLWQRKALSNKLSRFLYHWQNNYYRQI